MFTRFNIPQYIVYYISFHCFVNNKTNEYPTTKQHYYLLRISFGGIDFNYSLFWSMAIYKVRKRNGAIIDFDISKIELAIKKAIEAVEGTDFSEVSTLAHKVSASVEAKIGKDIPNVEDIQDAVEQILVKEGHDTVAKAYIIYRQKRAESRSNQSVVVEVEKTMGEYLDNLDWRINENANIGYSIGGLILKNSEKITANYWLSHVYPEEIGNAHRNGDYHIHDLGMFSPYCAGWSLRQLLEEGFNGIT